MATKWDKTPSSKEDVFKEAASDVERTHKGMKAGSSDLKGGAQQAVKEAGGRAILRNVGRMGAAHLATKAGLDLGEEIERRTGVGKKFVEKSGLGDAVERAVRKSHEGVQLTPEARERVASGETEGMKRGGKVKPTASSRADGIAKRGKTRGRVL